MKIRRIVAAASAALILLLYILSILFAVIGSPLSRQLLMASIFLSVIIPVILYGFLIYSRNTTERKSGEAPGRTDDAEPGQNAAEAPEEKPGERQE